MIYHEVDQHPISDHLSMEMPLLDTLAAGHAIKQGMGDTAVVIRMGRHRNNTWGYNDI